MKEGKKKTNARRTSSSSASRRVVPKNQTPKMPAQRSEPPKVKKIDIDEVSKDFDDVENEDRRLIVFIAIAILVIVGTVIGLLVGCEKKEKENPEPIKPGGTDVVVPEKPDEKGNKEDKDEGVVTKEIVRKVRATYSPNKNNKKDNSDSDKKKEETVTYNVTFYLGEETKVEEVESGKTPSEYVPEGYSSCKYYTKSSSAEETNQADQTDETEENEISEYDINTPITENINIYMSCEIITYSVNYGDGVVTGNPSSYEVTDGTVELTALETELFFNGWYTEPDGGGKKVTALDKSIIEYADSNNVIRLYAYITEEPVEDDVIDDKPVCEDPTSSECDATSVGDNPRLDGRSEIEVLEDESEPQVVENESEPQVVENESEPQIVENESEPQVVENESEPQVVENESEPQVVEDESKPQVVENESEPQVVENESEPQVVENESEPQVVEDESKPQVVENESEPQVVENESEPQVVENESEEQTSKQPVQKAVEEENTIEKTKIVEETEQVEKTEKVEEPKKEVKENTAEKTKQETPTKVEESIKPAVTSSTDKDDEPEAPVLDDTLTE